MLHWLTQHQPCTCITINPPLISCDVNSSAIAHVVFDLPVRDSYRWPVVPSPVPPLDVLLASCLHINSRQVQHNSLTARHRYPWISTELPPHVDQSRPDHQRSFIPAPICNRLAQSPSPPTWVSSAVNLATARQHMQPPPSPNTTMTRARRTTP